jgi:hypothetical protein
MSHDDVISEIWYQFRISGAIISLHAKFKPDPSYIKVMFLNDLKMTHDDVIDKIWYQIRTPGAVISLHAKFGPNRSNFGKTDSRNPAIILVGSCRIKFYIRQFLVSWGS